MFTKTFVKRLFGSLAVGLGLGGTASAETPFVIGLDADFSGPLSEVSVAVQQGAEAAVLEINRAGGINGRMLDLVVTNHRSNPRRAEDHLTDGHAAGMVAMISGAQSTAAIAKLEAAHAAGIPVISAFPSSSKITRNGLSPNPAFRVSASGASSNQFLVQEATKQGGSRIALLIENSVWGTSNNASVQRAIKDLGNGEIVATGWFALGGEDFDQAFDTVIAAAPDTILLFGKPDQGIALLSALDRQPQTSRPMALMHWGVAQGRAFGQTAATYGEVDYGIFQTFNFDMAQDHDRAAALLALTCELHDICTKNDALTPSPLAQAYDTVHLIALGLREVAAGAAPDLTSALQNLPFHDGLIRSYHPAFTSDEREAFDADDYILVRYDEGGVPIPIDVVKTASR